MKWKRIWISFWLLTLLAAFIVTLINRAPYFLLGGSSSVAPVMEELLSKYSDNHKNGDFNYVSSASAGAPPRVEKNIFGIGWLSENYHSDPSNPNLLSFEMMKDALIIVYNVPSDYLKYPDEPLDFDVEKLQELYFDADDWSNVFPDDIVKKLPIKKFTRPNGSGTRTVFDDIALNNRKDYTANTVDSSGAMLNLEEGGVGYTSFADFNQAKNPSVKAGNWNHMAASVDNIGDIYRLWRPFTGLINKKYKYKAEIINLLKWIFDDNNQVVDDIFNKYGPKYKLEDTEDNLKLKKWLYNEN